MNKYRTYLEPKQSKQTMRLSTRVMVTNLSKETSGKDTKSDKVYITDTVKFLTDFLMITNRNTIPTKGVVIRIILAYGNKDLSHEDSKDMCHAPSDDIFDATPVKADRPLENKPARK